MGLSINTGKVYETDKFGKVLIYFDGSSLNMFKVDGATLNLYHHKLWETYIEEDSYYAPIEPIDEIEWEELWGYQIEEELYRNLFYVVIAELFLGGTWLRNENNNYTCL